MTAEKKLPASIGLLIIGDEILSGRHVDKHFAKVLGLLAARKLKLSWAEIIGDDPARITATLRRVFAGSDVVLSTGGIGATPDDHTRQCAAAALGVPLVKHAEAQRLITEHMQAVAAKNGESWEPDRADNRQRLKMGEFPRGAEILPNPYNHISGFYCHSASGATAYFVPGFPVMAWPMMAWALDREVADGHLHTVAWLERSIIVHGSGEAILTPIMERIERTHPGVTVFSLPSVDDPVYGPHIDLGVKGDPALVGAAFDDLKTQIKPLGLSLGPESTCS